MVFLVFALIVLALKGYTVFLIVKLVYLCRADIAGRVAKV